MYSELGMKQPCLLTIYHDYLLLFDSKIYKFGQNGEINEHDFIL